MFDPAQIRALSRSLSRSPVRGLVQSGDIVYPTLPISSILASAVYQVDGNLAASYPGSGQTLANVIAAPADGAGQTDYDFWMGSTSTPTTDDPAFVVGPPGRFAFDGGDLIGIKTEQNFLKDLARSDQADKWWMAMAFMTGSLAGAQNIWGNSNGSGAVGTRIDLSATSGQLNVRRSTGVTTTTTTPGPVVPALTPSLVVFTYDKGTRGYQIAVNARAFTAGTLTDDTITTQGTGRMFLGGANGGTAKLPAGSEVYGSAMGNDTLTAGQLDSLVDYYNALHGRTYA